MPKPNKPYIVGITGGSASGKTFCLERLLESFTAQQLTLISQDNYYHDLQDQPPDETGEVNFDHPNSMNLDRFVQHLHALTQGQAVTVREYTFNHPDKKPRQFTYQPAPIIIVEGLFVMHPFEARQLMDLRVFVEADEHIKLERRLLRDLNERGYDINETLKLYRKAVPMFRRYVEPFKYECDIVLPNNHSLVAGVQVLVNHLKVVLGERSA
jgi:uridine kinase